MNKPLTEHQSWRAEVIELRLMNEWNLYSEAMEIASGVWALDLDENEMIERLSLRLRGVVGFAAALESNRREAAATRAAVCREVAEYFVTEHRHFVVSTTAAEA